MPRSKRSIDLSEPDRRENPDATPAEKLILAELAIMREQLANLVRYLRTKEAAAIKRRNTLYTRTDAAVVAKHQPTEEEVQSAMRQQSSWKAQQTRKIRQ